MSAWITTDHQKPDNEQTVLGYWAPNTVHKDAIYESLTFHACDSEVDGRDVWIDWMGEEEDAPDKWLPLDALPPCHRQVTD